MENNIRNLIKQYVDGLQWENALFWADIMTTLSSANVDDVLIYVRCLIELGQHLRALSILESRALLRSHKVFQYFGAQCLFASHRYEDVVQLVEGPIFADRSRDISGAFNISCRVSTNLSSDDVSTLSKYVDDWKIDSGLLLLLGKAYEKLENRLQAANAYKQCLIKDQNCVEAFDRLIRRHMLTETEETELLQRLFKDHDDGTPNRSTMLCKLTEFLYKNKATVNSFDDTTVDDQMATFGLSAELRTKLATNLSVMAGEAERLYFQSNCRESYAITNRILNREEYHSDALPVHVANLVASSKTTELFSLAHKLIDSFPESLISWYAVACYYYSIENYEAAKRFFHKCTLLDAQHGASWIGYGHSFAIEQEHDQAMNCYVKAAKVMSSCHLPLMYVGLEYSLTNNLRLAEKFFSQACQMSPEDPYVLHELGVLFYRLDNYVKAEEYFKKAEKVLGTKTSWEQLLNNLGHVTRKLKRYDDALDYHRRALRLSPRNASTIAAIGYLHMFLEQFDAAVDYFHQSLSLKRDDAFVTALLTKAMDILNDSWKAPFQEPPALTVPKIKLQGTTPKKSVVEIRIEDEMPSDIEMEDA